MRYFARRLPKGVWERPTTGSNPCPCLQREVSMPLTNAGKTYELNWMRAIEKGTSNFDPYDECSVAVDQNK